MESESYSRIRLRENEYERLVPRFVQRVSEHWLWAEWKPLLDSPVGRVRPDVALIASDLSRWCVVEVELASHPESHFRDQFASLEAAYYGTHLLAGLVAAFPELDPSDVERLLRDEPPTLLCIADEASDALLNACRDFGFELAIGTPYHSTSGSYAVEWRRIPPAFTAAWRTNGVEYPLRPAAELLGGRQRASLPRDFPNHRKFTLRSGQTIYPVRVYAFEAARAFYLPAGTTQVAGRPLLLRPLDPDNAQYELVNGEVLG